jgi:hypothetical protein
MVLILSVYFTLNYCLLKFLLLCNHFELVFGENDCFVFVSILVSLIVFV